jgi:integrase/recombinase XerC
MINEFITHLAVNRGYSDGTCRGYENDLRDFQRWAVRYAHLDRWSNVTEDMLNDYVNDLVNNEKQPATIKRRLSAIRTFYNWARQQHKTERNPAKYTSTPKLAKRLPKTIDLAAIHAAVYDKGIDYQTRGLIAMMIETGMRITEARTITGTSIDRKEQSIKVVGKGNKERIVYYGCVTANYLEKHYKDGRIFDYEDRDARYRIWEAISKHSTRNDASSHQLRHTYATKMVEQGMQLYTLGLLMGHSDTRTTEKYLALDQQHIKQEYASRAMQI